MAEREQEDCEGIEESRDRIFGILETEHTAHKVPYNRMVLAGFSQGGALSLFAGYQMPSAEQRLAGILCMSGYLAGAKQFKLTPGLEDTPTLHCHGTQDPMVAWSLAQKTRDIVTNTHGATNYELRDYPMQHTVTIEEIQYAARFLSQILPVEPGACADKPPKDMSVSELKDAILKGGLGQKAVGLIEREDLVKLLEKEDQEKK